MKVTTSWQKILPSSAQHENYEQLLQDIVLQTFAWRPMEGDQLGQRICRYIKIWAASGNWQWLHLVRIDDCQSTELWSQATKSGTISTATVGRNGSKLSFYCAERQGYTKQTGSGKHNTFMGVGDSEETSQLGDVRVASTQRPSTLLVVNPETFNSEERG